MLKPLPDRIPIRPETGADLTPRSSGSTDCTAAHISNHSVSIGRPLRTAAVNGRRQSGLMHTRGRYIIRLMTGAFGGGTRPLTTRELVGHLGNPLKVRYNIPTKGSIRRKDTSGGDRPGRKKFLNLRDWILISVFLGIHLTPIRKMGGRRS